MPGDETGPHPGTHIALKLTEDKVVSSLAAACRHEFEPLVTSLFLFMKLTVLRLETSEKSTRIAMEERKLSARRKTRRLAALFVGRLLRDEERGSGNRKGRNNQNAAHKEKHT